MRAVACRMHASEEDAATGATILELDPARSRRAATQPEPPPAPSPAGATPAPVAVAPAAEVAAPSYGGRRSIVAAVAAATVLLLAGATAGWTLRPVPSRSTRVVSPAPRPAAEPAGGTATGEESGSPTATAPAPGAPEPEGTQPTAKAPTGLGPAGTATPPGAGSSPSPPQPGPKPPPTHPVPVPALPPRPAPPQQPPVPKHASIEIQRADGQPGPLGRDVRLAGSVEGYGMGCYWGGWEVRTASGWQGRFLKGLLRPGAAGAFVLGGLQLGSEAETTSEWHPILVGATSAGCHLIATHRTAIGQYTGPWPSDGLAVLYRGGPVHRAD